MELTIDEFPSIPSQKSDINTNTKTVLEDGEVLDDSMGQWPAVISNQPLQTTFKIPPKKASNSKEQSTPTTLTREQRNRVIQVCRELHKYSFRDVDKLQNINKDKRRRIISKAMYVELGDYDPSDEHVANYSGPKIIRLYQKLTEKRINAETLYLQIFNQLTK